MGLRLFQDIVLSGRNIVYAGTVTKQHPCPIPAHFPLTPLPPTITPEFSEKIFDFGGEGRHTGNDPTETVQDIAGIRKSGWWM